MNTVHINDTGSLDQVVSTVADKLNSQLSAGKRVTWFICGGSNIPLITEIMTHVDPRATPALTVLLTDERYGIPGHDDSNWKQLDDAGFEPHDATVIRTLQAEQTLEGTCASYGDHVRRAVESADIVIAHFGIGGDGHIAGILPESDASRMDSQDDPWVTGYDAGNFMRITITPKVWDAIDIAYACAFGDSKRQAISRLVSEEPSIEEQPAQLLKRLDEATIFTDIV